MSRRRTPLAQSLLLGLVLTASMVATAAPPAVHGAPQSLIAHLASIDVLEGEFEQVRHIAVLAIPLQSSGTFQYRRDQGIVWRTEHPVASEIHITAERGIVAIDDRGDAHALPASEVVASIFLSLFSGELERLAGYFTIEAVNPETTRDSTTNSWALRLTPHISAIANQIDHIRIAGSDYVEAVAIHEVNGDRSELTLALAPHNKRTPQ